jgi:hypothetical protein
MYVGNHSLSRVFETYINTFIVVIIYVVVMSVINLLARRVVG